MKLPKPHLLPRLSNPSPPSPHHFPSAAVMSIRAASTPQQALHLYRMRLHRGNPNGVDPFDSFAAVFIVKSCSNLFATTTHLLPHLHSHFRKTGLLSHIHVSTVLLHSYAVFSFDHARQLFDEIPNRNVVTENTMITCYSKFGDVNAARSLFNAMPERDIASWSAMIGTYVNRGNTTQGVALFREMTCRCQGRFKADALILVTMLTACASSGSLMLSGKSIHGFCVRDGLEISEQLGTALIDMYVKSGWLRSAYLVFERMSERTVMHWSAMICGLALHGHGRDAVAFFEEMRKAGVRPNAITFTGVLNACCHGGLVDEGQRYFSAMVEQFGCQPSIYHYGCMVDLFAKAGRLRDAYYVIQNMKVEPNIVVWSAFLGACKKHKDFKAAEPVLEKVLQMANPDTDGGVYTLICDIYSMSGRWSDVERVRKLMDENCVKKNRGSSFIGVEETRKSVESSL